VTLRQTIEAITRRALTSSFGAALSYDPLDGSGVLTLEAIDGGPLEGIFDADAEHYQELRPDGPMVVARRPKLVIELDRLGRMPVSGDKFTMTEGAHVGETYTIEEVELTSAQEARCWCVGGDFAA
jgi:hypothetical protein